MTEQEFIESGRCLLIFIWLIRRRPPQNIFAAADLVKVDQAEIFRDDRAPARETRCRCRLRAFFRSQTFCQLFPLLKAEFWPTQPVCGRKLH
jgi:hypothetical protein